MTGDRSHGDDRQGGGEGTEGQRGTGPRDGPGTGEGNGCPRARRSVSHWNLENPETATAALRGVPGTEHNLGGVRWLHE